MTKRKAEYTLWTTSKSEWSQPLEGVELSEKDKDELIEFARDLKDERLKDLLSPFDTPVTQDTLSKSVGQK